MALVKTMKWFGAERGVWLGALALLVSSALACSELDPVSVESLCEGPGPVLEECPQCQVPPFNSECPQCQQSGVDADTCLPPAEQSMTGEGPLTGTDGGSTVNGEGGAGADGSSGEGNGTPGDGTPGNGTPGDGTPGDGTPGDGSMGTGGNGSTPPEGTAGADGSPGPGGSDGSNTPEDRGPRGCLGDQDCTTEGFPACRPDGLCTECLNDEHCPAGSQCDRPTNRCVQCVEPSGCEALGMVCNLNTRSCVGCLSNVDCRAPTPACTPTNECVACTDDSYCPAETRACDQMTCYECKSDEYCNSAGKHACIEAEHRCVECETDSHCRSEAGRPHCLVADNACVECLTNADCSDPSASQCDTDSHTCVPCTSHTHCAEFAGTAPRCADGTCVACDIDGGICNGKACILSRNVCSDKDRASVRACAECVTSDECIAGHVCVNVKFGSYNTGDFCLPSLGAGFRACPRPYGREVANVTTLDGVRVTTLCALPETTTCQALLDTLAGKTCNDNNAACGLGRPVLGTNDGLCPSGVCTYNCTDDDFCPSDMICSTEAVCL